MPARPVIVLTGASGLIGQALTKALTQGGYDVRGMKSRTRGPGGMDVASGWIDAGFLEGAEAVIHLSGEPIAQRWTKAAKARILSSRVDGTRLLAATLAKLAHPPKTFLSMSGINRYGVWRSRETVTEASTLSNEGFLAEISAKWESATQVAVDCARAWSWRAPEGRSRRCASPFPSASADRLGPASNVSAGSVSATWCGSFNGPWYTLKSRAG